MIAEQGGLHSRCMTTTSRIAKSFSVSQQNISHVLKQLHLQDLIVRVPTNKGVTLSITAKGTKILRGQKSRLDKILSPQKELAGTVITGLGEGRYYTELSGYKKQFRDKLGIDPYPGTLNLKVAPAQRKRFLEDKKHAVIEGFKTKKRTCGSLISYDVIVDGLKAALIIPERSPTSEIEIELISKENLRKALKLKDGSRVKIRERKMTNEN